MATLETGRPCGTVVAGMKLAVERVPVDHPALVAHLIDRGRRHALVFGESAFAWDYGLKHQSSVWFSLTSG